MKTERKRLIKVIATRSPTEFEDRYNEAVRELEVVDSSISCNQEGFVAILTYEVVISEPDSIADEFKAQGISFKCDECPYMEDPQDKRVKWVHCRYASTGMTHRYHDACEIMYRDVKAGTIKPGDMKL